ncbi:hypothetical protein C6496_07065 [Candidatus Poribacteria bacterium]|nr:MAG: hypothetical protein C6496_07065 [Candidatus Poribacteria bacterium]
MKILTIGILALFMMNGTIKADDHSAANNIITLNLDDTSEVLVQGFIAPIAHTISNFHVKWKTLANLRVAEPEKQYPASTFDAFLPDKSVSVGERWAVNEEGVLALLRQLHPNPNLYMHINAGDSYGLWACLRAYNDKFADIVFRIHAEFKLEDGWFTPSQFTGHLVIDRIEEKVAFFKMYVPEGPVNFDVNWKAEKDKPYFFADSGLCSQMELHTGTQDILQGIKFTESITQETAERSLAQRFYKSQQINWVSPDQALKMTQTQQKPIHAISIDGPLMDESC